MNNNNISYILTLTPEQLAVVKRACEFYCRVRLGQFNEISDETLDIKRFKDDFYERREEMERYLLYARMCAFPELMGAGHSYGVGHDVTSDIAWNVYQVTRYAEAHVKNPKGGYTVDFDRPMDFGGVGLPGCVIREDAL